MPTVSQNTSVTITPQRFIDSCSDQELLELDLLMNSHQVRNRIRVIEKKAREDLVKCVHRPGPPPMRGT